MQMKKIVIAKPFFLALPVLKEITSVSIACFACAKVEVEPDMTCLSYSFLEEIIARLAYV